MITEVSREAIKINGMVKVVIDMHQVTCTETFPSTKLPVAARNFKVIAVQQQKRLKKFLSL